MNANEFLTWGTWLRHIEPNLATKKKDLDVTRWGKAGENQVIHEPSLGQRDSSCCSPRPCSKTRAVAPGGGERDYLLPY